ncbi:MAG: hypothetical protein ACI4NW_05290 [Stenotrophomonas sp.]
MSTRVDTELSWRADSALALQAQLGLESLPAAQAALLDKKPRERWLMAAWLAVNAGRLAYPLRVHSSERPDFLLSAPGLAIGVECMEVVPEELKRLQTQLREVNSGWVRPVLAPGEHDWDWSNPMLQRLLAPRGGRPGYDSEDPEGLWLAVMRWAVTKKREVIAREGFSRQPHNVLLLHDNWPLPALPCAPLAQGRPSPLWLQLVQQLQQQLFAEDAFADWQQVAIVQAGWVWTLAMDGVQVLPRV